MGSTGIDRRCKRQVSMQGVRMGPLKRKSDRFNWRKHLRARSLIHQVERPNPRLQEPGRATLPSLPFAWEGFRVPQMRTG